MKIALVSHGSSRPEAQVQSALLARNLSARLGQPVDPVSWKQPARTFRAATGAPEGENVIAWLTRQLSEGHRQFVFIPFFVTANGAMGQALQAAIAQLHAGRGGFAYTFAGGLQQPGLLGHVVSDRIHEIVTGAGLRAPAVLVVDHGSPSPAAARMRNHVAHEIRARLAGCVGSVGTASLEGGAFAHNQPQCSACLGRPPFDGGHVVVAPLFLAAGRHAGHDGDLHRIAAEAESRSGGRLKCHFTAPIALHPHVPEALAATVRTALASFEAGTGPGTGGASNAGAPFSARALRLGPGQRHPAARIPAAPGRPRTPSSRIFA